MADNFIKLTTDKSVKTGSHQCETRGSAEAEATNALIIFIKNPQLGKVKTRLARTMGDEKALEIYTELTHITRENAKILRGVKRHIFYSDFIDKTDDWSSKMFKKWVQQGEDLGARMANAFSEVFKKHENVCIIGSDCPTLSPAILQQASKALNTHDFVVGPSTDGGYYLLGVSKNVQDFQFIFDNMAWSTETVLAETVKRISAKGKTLYFLPELTDIDEEKDWIAFQKILIN
jgi:uncharacterized protein